MSLQSACGQALLQPESILTCRGDIASHRHGTPPVFDGTSVAHPDRKRTIVIGY
jgi:hypothetical protein